MNPFELHIYVLVFLFSVMLDVTYTVYLDCCSTTAFGSCSLSVYLPLSLNDDFCVERSLINRTDAHQVNGNKRAIDSTWQYE